MARSRNIKPGFFQNEELVELPYSYRLLFIGLWTIADREGRLENRPKKIKMQLFPADDLDLPEALLGLSKQKLITLYDVDSIEYIYINNFLVHQNPHHKEAKSTIPKPTSPRQASGLPSTNPADSLLPITDPLNPHTDPLKKKGERKSSRFKPPTPQELSDYCQSKNIILDINHFIDYYESNGWMVGRNKMKDWKAASRNWVKRNYNTGVNNGNKKLTAIERVRKANGLDTTPISDAKPYCKIVGENDDDLRP